VFSSTGKFLGSASTNSTGHYIVKGLAAATADRVCAAPDHVSLTVTFHGRCWKTIAWNGGALPSGTTAVGVHLGHTHTGISFKLGKTVIQLGSIAGVVTELVGGLPLSGASVTVFTSGGAFAGSASTNSSGQYTVANLRASSTGYIVCASAEFASDGASPPVTGWAPRCFASAGWNGLQPPGGATK